VSDVENKLIRISMYAEKHINEQGRQPSKSTEGKERNNEVCRIGAVTERRGTKQADE